MEKVLKYNSNKTIQIINKYDEAEREIISFFNSEPRTTLAIRIQISRHHHHTGEGGNGLKSVHGDHSENYVLVKMHYKDKKKSFGEIKGFNIQSSLLRKF